MIPHYTQICTQFTYRNFTWSDECGIRIMNISTRTSRMWENLLEIIEALQLTRELFQPSNSSIVSILPLVNLKGETRRCLFLVRSNWIQNETETSYSEIINFFSSKNPINWIPRKKSFNCNWHVLFTTCQWYLLSVSYNWPTENEHELNLFSENRVYKFNIFVIFPHILAPLKVTIGPISDLYHTEWHIHSQNWMKFRI